MSEPRTFRELTVWTKSVDLVVAIYKLTEHFPRPEMFGLVSQLRRAAVSIPANIAEGNSRYSTLAYLNHVHVALGSHGEVRALLEISGRLGYSDSQGIAQVAHQVDEVGRLLAGLRKALERRAAGPSDP
jgi:four helix bundle protein